MIDLSVTQRPSSTIVLRAIPCSGWVFAQGISLIVDRSVTEQNGDLVLACWGGDSPICKIIQGPPKAIALHSANPDFPPLISPNDAEVELFAIVWFAKQCVLEIILGNLVNTASKL